MPIYLAGRLEIVRGDLTTLQVDAIVVLCCFSDADRASFVAAARELLGD